MVSYFVYLESDGDGEFRSIKSEYGSQTQDATHKKESRIKLHVQSAYAIALVFRTIAEVVFLWLQMTIYGFKVNEVFRCERYEVNLAQIVLMSFWFQVSMCQCGRLLCVTSERENTYAFVHVRSFASMYRAMCCRFESDSFKI